MSGFKKISKEPDKMILARMQKSRNDWRNKAIDRGRRLKEKKRQAKKWKIKAEEAKRNNLELKKKLAESDLLTNRTQPVNVYLNIQVISVVFFVFGIVSCRAVPRLLQLCRKWWHLPINKTPHHSSVINWLCRAGLGMLSTVVPWPERAWVAIIDTTVSYAKQKILVVLRVPLDYIAQNKKAPTLDDVECIGIVIRDAWNGTAVCEALTPILAQSGTPAVILKDGGGDLNCGVKSWCEKQDSKVIIVRDIGHIIANELKRVYTANAVLDAFLKLIDTIRSQLCQTQLASLRPPKLRTKGRFQSISRVAEWAQNILDLIGGQGRATTGSLFETIRKAFSGLAKMRWLIERLARDCVAANQIMHILKNQGLNQISYAHVRSILETLPAKRGITKKVSTWLEQHMRAQCLLGIGQTPLMVSSDIIESLMGRIKMVIERNPLPEFGRMSLTVPLLCGNHTQHSIESAIASCPHATLEKYIQDNINNTMRKQKAKIIKEMSQITNPKTVGDVPP